MSSSKFLCYAVIGVEALSGAAALYTLYNPKPFLKFWFGDDELDDNGQGVLNLLLAVSLGMRVSSALTLTNGSEAEIRRLAQGELSQLILCGLSRFIVKPKKQNVWVPVVLVAAGSELIMALYLVNRK